MRRDKLSDLDWRSSNVAIPSAGPETNFLEYEIRVAKAWTLENLSVSTAAKAPLAVCPESMCVLGFPISLLEIRHLE